MWLRQSFASFLWVMCLVSSCEKPAHGQASQLQEKAASESSKAFDFEIVSVKRNKTDIAHPGSMVTGDGFDAENQPLSVVLIYAFGFSRNPQKDDFSGLPDWVETERFDIIAKVSQGDIPAWKKLSASDRQAMIRKILADRFKLITHEEARSIPIYVLAISSGGPKLAEVEARSTASGSNEGYVTQSRTGMDINAVGAHATMKTLAAYLARQQDIGREVQDQTGLTGHYDFSLKFTTASNGVANNSNDPPEVSSSPFITTALKEQMGLMLVPKEGTRKTIVIDHIEQPSAN